ncbi:MAG: TIGR02453 family protein, partial [Flavobacteriaceae bacterium]
MITLPQDAFSFFKALENNNTREWFAPQKERFKRNEGQVKQFAQALKEAMNQHDTVDRFKLFRIYRDVRFSKNKTPYKTHFGISFHREKPALRGGYYLHIKPGDTFIATGFWNPH